jgi:hypothetical protein
MALYIPTHSTPSLHSTTHFTFLEPNQRQRIPLPHSKSTSLHVPTFLIKMSYSSVLLGSTSTEATSATSSPVDEIPNVLFDGQVKVKIVKVSTCHLGYAFKS